MTPQAPTVEGLVWRPAVPDDAAAIAALQDVCFAVDGGYREVAEEVEERFGSPMLDPSTNTLVGVIDGNVVISLWSLIVPNATDMWNVYDDNYIHPDHRSELMKNFALDWWENRAMERLANRHDDLPAVLHQHVYPTQDDHTEFIKQRGFSPSLYFDELRRDLTRTIPDPTLPSACTLVPVASVAPEAVLAIRNESFADHRGSQPWTLEMWLSLESEFNRPDASFVVMDGDAPVAFLISGVYPHEFDDKGYSEGWIERIGTARSHRGKGLATALICAAMQVFREDGLEFATLEVDTENPTGAAGLYAKLGFERVRGYVDYTRTIERKAALHG
jgi:ribosomal protein S18 acetylase RimI-like enzyme